MYHFKKGITTMSKILKDEFLEMSIIDQSHRGIPFKPRVITAMNFDIHKHPEILNEPEGSFFILCETGDCDVYEKNEKGWRKLDKSFAFDFLHTKISK
jgi:hypothetical protein